MMNPSDFKPYSRDFDAFLCENMPDLSPDDVVQNVTPWRKAMNRILIGTALCNIVFHFWKLDIFLPSLGILLIFLGFRSLRRENKWFFGGFILACIRVGYQVFSLILSSTVFSGTLGSTFPLQAAGSCVLLLSLIHPFFLWRGILTVQKKSGLRPHAKSAVFLICWQFLIAGLYFLKVDAVILLIVMLLLYALILYSLFRLSHALDDAGYLVSLCPVRLSDKVLSFFLLASVLLGCCIGYLCFNSFSMNWQPFSAETSDEICSVKSHLEELGFPKDVLEDLRTEDLLSCKDASFVLCYTRSHEIPHSDGSKETLCFTGVAVRLANERESWKLIHHFRFPDSHFSVGTESIELWPADTLDGWEISGEITGQVLYDENGIHYAAPFYSLCETQYTKRDLFGNESTQIYPFAEFSFPRTGSNQRCYLAYDAAEVSDGCIINSWVNYTHQRSRMQYPVMTAKEKRLANTWNEAGAFYTVQDALQLYPKGNTAEPLF